MLSGVIHEFAHVARNASFEQDMVAANRAEENAGMHSHSESLQRRMGETSFQGPPAMGTEASDNKKANRWIQEASVE